MNSIFFELDGKPFHALAAGNRANPLLLFLHGFPEYSGAWARIMPEFEQDYYCVAPDQRGYGKSWRGGGISDYAVKHLSADALSMIEMFGNGKAAAVVGHDWGASVAYACAMRAPGMIAKLIIANGVHPAPFQAELAKGGAQSEASQYIEWLRAPGSEALLVANNFERMFGLFSRHMNMDWLTAEFQSRYKDAWKDEPGVRAMVNWYRATPLLVAKPGAPIHPRDLPQWDAATLRIGMPHLLLWGLGDKALLPECRLGLGDYCDDLTTLEREDADHWIIHQHSDWVATQIKLFLSRP